MADKFGVCAGSDWSASSDDVVLLIHVWGVNLSLSAKRD